MIVENDFILPSLTPQNVIPGQYNEANDNYKLLSHILLIFEYHIYISKKKTNIKDRYSNTQFNKSKDEGEANKHWYHQ